MLCMYGIYWIFLDYLGRYLDFDVGGAGLKTRGCGISEAWFF
jgi:hypothetical protein